MAAFGSRPLSHVEFPYIFADATYLKGRVGGQVVARAVVVATGVAMTGEREVLGCAGATPRTRHSDLRRWTKNADADWIAGIEVVATDLAESFRAGLSPKLDHALRVADPFHRLDAWRAARRHLTLEGLGA